MIPPTLRLLLAIIVWCVASSANAQRLSQLAAPPDWSRLEVFQGTITRADFERLLDTVYAPGGAWRGMIEVRDREAVIHKTLAPPETMTLRFAPDAASARRVKRNWRPAKSRSMPKGPKKLAGVSLVLDPGHIGGEWGLMEERSFSRPGDSPVREGDLTLAVAKLAAVELRRLGADVTLTRTKTAPLSRFTVDALRPQARKELALLGVAEPRENYDGPRDPGKANTVQWQAERLFYRVAEIRERARIVNKLMVPDLVVCIHFNADDWADPAAPVFTPRNDLHILVHGCYATDELRFDDQRLEMLLKLLNRSHDEELAAAAAVSGALSKSTGLPPFKYTTPNAVRVGQDEFIWARNLLANRLFACPVVFLEPYRMNNEETYARVQAGDYMGEREVAGKKRPSLVREYAKAIVDGLRQHYENARNPKR
jgi:hypothetical protein